MSLTPIIQILKINDLRSGEKNGRKWEMQDAEALLLSEAGEIEAVCVVMLPKDLRGKALPGHYRAEFVLRPNMASRRLEAQIQTLVPVRLPAASKA